MNKCNMCGETTQMYEEDPSQYGLINATVSGGYHSPALQDMSVYKFSFCEYCLDHIFQQCVNPPQGWEYSFHKYQPIEEQLKDDKYINGDLPSYRERILEEKLRRDKLRAAKTPYKPTSKELLDYTKSWHSFGNEETAPTKEHQDKMKALRDETVRLFNNLSEEEKTEQIYHHNSYPHSKALPPEQWWDSRIPKDEELVSQETHDAYEKLCEITYMEVPYDDPNHEQKRKEMKKVFKEFFDSMSDEAKKIYRSLYNIVFDIKDPEQEARWDEIMKNLPEGESVMLFPRPEYPNE